MLLGFPVGLVAPHPPSDDTVYVLLNLRSPKDGGYSI